MRIGNTKYRNYSFIIHLPTLIFTYHKLFVCISLINRIMIIIEQVTFCSRFVIIKIEKVKYAVYNDIEFKNYTAMNLIFVSIEVFVICIYLENNVSYSSHLQIIIHYIQDVTQNITGVCPINSAIHFSYRVI